MRTAKRSDAPAAESHSCRPAGPARPRRARTTRLTMLAAAAVTPFFTSNGLRGQVFVLVGATVVMGSVLLPAAQAMAVAVVATGVDLSAPGTCPGNFAKLAGLTGATNTVNYLCATLAAAIVAALLGGGSIGRWIHAASGRCVFVVIAESGTASYANLGWGRRSGGLERAPVGGSSLAPWFSSTNGRR
jgi:hypothetical protein